MTEHEDPNPTGSLPAVVPDEATGHDDAREQVPDGISGSFASSTWGALVVGALLLILLLVFILQNLHSVRLYVFAWEVTFPAGIGILLAAITGALIMACVGAWRMVELRRQVRRVQKASRSSQR